MFTAWLFRLELINLLQFLHFLQKNVCFEKIAEKFIADSKAYPAKSDLKLRTKNRSLYL
jgi:hypothetical protein